MFDVRYGYLRMVIITGLTTHADRKIVGDDIYYTLPGYSVKQHLHWKWPIICKRATYVQDDNADIVVSKHGRVYQLYKDANDVAGLSEHFADRRKAKV